LHLNIAFWRCGLPDPLALGQTIVRQGLAQAGAVVGGTQETGRAGYLASSLASASSEQAWEHTMRDERDLNNPIDYVHWNPVKHGLVSAVKDWPYSTFHRYVQAGLLPADRITGGGAVAIETGEIE
jgi:hypothetical protein